MRLILSAFTWVSGHLVARFAEKAHVSLEPCNHVTQDFQLLALLIT